MQLSQNLIRLQSQLMALDQPKVMGILNLTPDSFYVSGRSGSLESALVKAETHLKAGASFLDIGAYSSRPGAEDISEDLELSRLMPIVEKLLKTFPEAYLSIDTFRARVAKEAVQAGAHMINDISGGDLDTDMFKVAADLQVPYILMHMQGTPQTMQLNPQYENVTLQVIQTLAAKIHRLRALGLRDIIVDPGFGFGKTLAHNYELMQHLQDLKILDCPLLVGVSRKGMIYKALGSDAEAALNGTTVLNTIALQKGANILRVHDVKEAMECIKLVDYLKSAGQQ